MVRGGGGRSGGIPLIEGPIREPCASGRVEKGRRVGRPEVLYIIYREMWKTADCGKSNGDSNPTEPQGKTSSPDRFFPIRRPFSFTPTLKTIG